MGTFGALAVLISFTLQWPTWVMFIAWVSYYIFGRSLKSSGLSLLQIAGGIAMGVIMQSTAMALNTVFGQFSLPIAVFVLIGSLAYISKIKFLSNIPAWFLGLIIFFGVHPPIEAIRILEIFIPIIAGFVFALSNDSIARLVEKKLVSI